MTDIEKAWGERETKLIRKTAKFRTVFGNEIVDELISVVEDSFKAGAEWQAKQSGWVKIEDMPDEWKDGRPVDLLSQFTCKCFMPDSEQHNRQYYQRHFSEKHGKICWKNGGFHRAPQEFIEYETDTGDITADVNKADWMRKRKITHVRLPPPLPEEE